MFCFILFFILFLFFLDKYDDIWTPELWGEERFEQVGTAEVPGDSQPIMPRDSGGDTRFQVYN